MVVDCLEQWIAGKSDKPRVLVLDNARIHRSRLVQSKLAEWEEKDFYIFNLPPYSPHLNIIEILWRRMKYEWLKPEDYASFEKLTEAIKEILSQLGTEYRIKFKDRRFIKQFCPLTYLKITRIYKVYCLCKFLFFFLRFIYQYFSFVFKGFRYKYLIPKAII